MEKQEIIKNHKQSLSRKQQLKITAYEFADQYEAQAIKSTNSADDNKKIIEHKVAVAQQIYEFLNK